MSRLQSSEKKFLYLIISGLLVGLFLNLNLRPLIADEGIRGVVAQELELNENLIVCTINNEPYYNKPPLYNWLIIVSANIVGEYNEFSLRLPMTLSLILSGFIIFFTLKNELGERIATISGLAYITSARILFYDSYLGLIDIFYSLTVYISFWVIYYFGKKEKYWHLFAISYFLTAIGVLMKGLPSFAFQGITLLTYFIYQKKLAKLFSVQHIVGFIFLAIPLGLFFYSYSFYGSLENYFVKLWTESSSRTVAEKSVLESVKHLFLFPFENVIYAILPWGLLFPLFWVKNVRTLIKKTPVLMTFFYFSCSNIIVYWLSPETRPRYLFMIYAMLIPLLIFAYENVRKDHLIKMTLNKVFLIISLVIIISPISLFFVDQNALKFIPYVYYVSISVIGIVCCIYLYFKSSISKLIVFLGVLMFIKISFSGVITPYRNLTELEDQFKLEVLKAIKVSDGKPLQILKGTPMGRENTFYIEAHRREILKRHYDNPKPGIHYIVDQNQLEEYDLKPLSKFRMRWEHRTSYIAELKE